MANKRQFVQFVDSKRIEVNITNRQPKPHLFKMASTQPCVLRCQDDNEERREEEGPMLTARRHQADWAEDDERAYRTGNDTAARARGCDVVVWR